MRPDGSGSTLNECESPRVPLPLRLDGFGSVLDEFGSLWVTLGRFRSGLGRFGWVLDGFGSSCVVWASLPPKPIIRETTLTSSLLCTGDSGPPKGAKNIRNL